MRIKSDWYRCRDGKTRWLSSKSSLMRLYRAAGRSDRLRPSALRNLLLNGGTRLTAIATETRRAETENTGSVEDEGAGPKDIAQ